jgi:hypothetical protein
MSGLCFVVCLLVVVTVNIGLALNFATRRADREARWAEIDERRQSAEREWMARRAQFNCTYALQKAEAGYTSGTGLPDCSTY